MRTVKCKKCGNDFREDDYNPAIHYSTPSSICPHCEIVNGKNPGEWYQDRTGEYKQKLEVE